MTPLPLGPQRGSDASAAISTSSRSSTAPAAISPKPAPNTTAPRRTALHRLAERGRDLGSRDREDDRVDGLGQLAGEGTQFRR